jgi:hypothetical protein
MFYVRAHEREYPFLRFLGEALQYLSGGEYDFTRRPQLREQTEDLCVLLQSKATLVIVDGLEQWLPAWQDSGDAVGLVGEALGDFLNAMATSVIGGSRLVITSRAVPAVLADLPVTYIGGGAGPAKVLGNLPAEEATALLKDLGVSQETGDLDKAAADWDGHPLALRVLGRISKREYGGTLADPSAVLPDDNEAELTRMLSGVVARHAASRAVMAAAARPDEWVGLDEIEAATGWPLRRIRRCLAALVDWNVATFNGESVKLNPLLSRYLVSRSAQPKGKTPRGQRKKRG